MIHNLHFRLMMAFIIVIVVTIGSASFFVARSIWSEIQTYEENDNAVRTARIEYIMSRFYFGNRSWDGIQPLVEELGTMEEKWIILTDANNSVIADSRKELLGKEYHAADNGIPLYLPRIISRPPTFPSTTAVPSSSVNQAVLLGTLYISPPGPGSVLTIYLTSAINRFLLWGGLLAIAIALIVTFVISRRILSPIKALTATAKKLGQGDFSQRVEFNGKGEVGRAGADF